MKTIVVGGGCFWCAEAIFQRLKGVKSVVSGYAGGTTENPNYDRHGDHAEVVQVTYDETVLDLPTIFDVFFYTHNPTTLNFQGYDKGTQYRSIILCAPEELPFAEAAREKAQEGWAEPIVTEIKLLDKFYPAEDYHQNYYNQNQTAPYCQVIINPKLEKFSEKFGDWLI